MRKNLSKESSKFSPKHVAANEIAANRVPFVLCCDVVVTFLSQVIFVFLLFLGMVVYVVKKKKNENYLK